MPQMSPMLWTLLLILSTLMMIQMNTMMFFNTKKTNIKNKIFKKINTSWKW